MSQVIDFLADLKIAHCPKSLSVPSDCLATIQRIRQPGDLDIGFNIKQGIFSCAMFVFLKGSHGVLSVIFGIFGKFGIEIGDPIFLGRKKFRRKKSENFWSIFFGPKFFDL